MSEYSMNIVTRDGAALIAQATAANPIVIVSGVSREDAATDASDLADKTVAWYTGKEGRVAAVSAAGGVARIVIAWGQEGVAQPAKSLAVLARLESQSVSQSVVLCAMSDPDSTIVLPGADDMAQAIEVPFNVVIDPTDDIQVTPGSAASLSDLDRFVSCHAPGDPTGPENQMIWGWKIFRTRLSAADARIENGRVSGALDFGGEPDNPAVARTKISRSESDALELTNGGYSVSLTSSGAVVLGADMSIHSDYTVRITSGDGGMVIIGEEVDVGGGVPFKGVLGSLYLNDVGGLFYLLVTLQNGADGDGFSRGDEIFTSLLVGQGDLSIAEPSLSPTGPVPATIKFRALQGVAFYRGTTGYTVSVLALRVA